MSTQADHPEHLDDYDLVVRKRSNTYYVFAPDLSIVAKGNSFDAATEDLQRQFEHLKKMLWDIELTTPDAPSDLTKGSPVAAKPKKPLLPNRTKALAIFGIALFLCLSAAGTGFVAFKVKEYIDTKVDILVTAIRASN